MENLDRNNKQRFFELFLLIAVSVFLLVDSINGLLVLKMGMPSVFSVVFKQGVLLLLIFYALQYSRKSALMIGIVLLVALVWALLRFVLLDSVAFFFSLQEAFKALYFFFVLFALSRFNSVNEFHVRLVLYAYLLTLVLNVVSSYVGIGYFSYGNYGAKGFLYGGNATSSIIIICSAYFLVSAYRRSVTLYLLTLSLMLFLSLIMGTKSGILGVFLCAVLVLLFNFNAKTLAVVLLLVSVFIMLGVTVFDKVLDSSIVERLVYFYEVGGLERALLSGREGKFMVIMPTFLSGSLQFILLGMHNNDLERLSETRIELDFFDMLVYFGLPLTLFIFFLHTIVFLKLWKLRNSPVALSALISSITLLLVSSVAGHVMFNGIVTPAWGAFVALALCVARNEFSRCQSLNSGNIVSNEYG
ncbi:O-antigen ligase family protein [Bowmanella dokdonensis]